MPNLPFNDRYILTPRYKAKFLPIVTQQKAQLPLKVFKVNHHKCPSFQKRHINFCVNC